MECAFRGNGTEASFVLPGVLQWEYPAHAFASICCRQRIWQEISRWQMPVIKKKGGNGDAIWRQNGTHGSRSNDGKRSWLLRWFWHAVLRQPNAWLPLPLWLCSFSTSMAQVGFGLRSWPWAWLWSWLAKMGTLWIPLVISFKVS